MKRRVLLGALALSLVACAQAVSDESDPERGALSLALTANDSGGVAYRLRNASIDVSGYPDGWFPSMPIGGIGGIAGAGGGGYFSQQYSSEDYLDQATINVRLVPGYYNVTLLNSDFYLERASIEGEWLRVEQAVLLTPPYQSTYVWDGGVAYVNFRFGVDGQLIDFRSGELQIGIEIEKPGEHCVPDMGWGGFGGPIGCGAAGGGTAGAGSAGVPAPIPID